MNLNSLLRSYLIFSVNISSRIVNLNGNKKTKTDKIADWGQTLQFDMPAMPITKLNITYCFMISKWPHAVGDSVLVTLSLQQDSVCFANSQTH